MLGNKTMLGKLNREYFLLFNGYLYQIYRFGLLNVWMLQYCSLLILTSPGSISDFYERVGFDSLRRALGTGAAYWHLLESNKNNELR